MTTTDEIRMYRLEVLQGLEPGFRTVIREDSVLLGSDDRCRVSLQDPGLAPQHAAFRRRDGRVFLQVLGDAEPVARDGEALKEAELHHGDVLRIGDLHLQFQVVEPLVHHGTRETGPIHRIGWMLLWLVSGIELMVLAWLWIQGPDRIGAAPETVAGADPAAVDSVSNELMSARSRLEQLEARQGQQSTEEIWAGGDSVLLSREIESLRQRVGQLDSTLEYLQDPTDPALNPPPPSRQARIEREARRQLTQARRLIAENRLDDADRQLAELLEMAPDQVNAYITRARLAERRDDLELAVANWDEVIQRAGGTVAHEEATAERIRLQREIRLRAAATDPPAPPAGDTEADEADTDSLAELEAIRAERQRLAAEMARAEARADVDAAARETADARREEARRAETERRQEEEQRQQEEQRLAAEQAAQQAQAEREREEAAARARAEQEAAARQARGQEAARERAEAEERRAAERRVQLAREEAMRAAAEGPARIRIGAVRREKFQDRENYEEIRLVRIQLNRRKSAGAIEPGRLQVEVQFYDRDRRTGEHGPSTVPAPRKGLELTEAWTDDTSRSLSALYMVPTGFRATERSRTGRDLQFYGYTVRVYYDGTLQDTYAFPGSLLNR